MSDLNLNLNLTEQDIADLWGEIDGILATPPPVNLATRPATPAAPTVVDDLPRANLQMVMRSIHRRKELRAFLIMVGAIIPGEDAPTSVNDTQIVLTEQLIGGLMALDADRLQRMITRAGKIASADRITDFATRIASYADDADPNDKASVYLWVSKVGATLRGES